MEDRIEVAAMALSQSGNIIITAKDRYTADDLIVCRDKWMFSVVKGYRKDAKQAKVIAHGVPAYVFGEDMEALQQEITHYSNNIQLATSPRWLTKEEGREGKLQSSVLLYLKTKQEADGVIKKGLHIGVVQTWCAAYRDTQSNSHCNAYQGFGHHSTVCGTKVSCQLCAGDHNTCYHVCPNSQISGNPGSHTTLKYANCQCPH